MTIEEIEQSVIGVFKNTLNDQSLEIKRETTADDVEGWDSITHLDLIVSVEKTFDIEINGFDVMGLKDVGDLIDLVQRKLQD